MKDRSYQLEGNTEISLRKLETCWLGLSDFNILVSNKLLMHVDLG